MRRRRAGDEVDVDLELDAQPREVTLPDELASVLDGDAAARDFFAGLSPSYKKAYITWIESAKKADTRSSRLDKVVGLLHQGKKQP